MAKIFLSQLAQLALVRKFVVLARRKECLTAQTNIWQLRLSESSFSKVKIGKDNEFGRVKPLGIDKGWSFKLTQS